MQGAASRYNRTRTITGQSESQFKQTIQTANKASHKRHELIEVVIGPRVEGQVSLYTARIFDRGPRMKSLFYPCVKCTCCRLILCVDGNAAAAVNEACVNKMGNLLDDPSMHKRLENHTNVGKRIIC